MLILTSHPPSSVDVTGGDISLFAILQTCRTFYHGEGIVSSSGVSISITGSEIAIDNRLAAWPPALVTGLRHLHLALESVAGMECHVYDAEIPPFDNEYLAEIAPLSRCRLHTLSLYHTHETPDHIGVDGVKCSFTWPGNLPDDALPRPFMPNEMTKNRYGPCAAMCEAMRKEIVMWQDCYKAFGVKHSVMRDCILCLSFRSNNGLHRKEGKRLCEHLKDVSLLTQFVKFVKNDCGVMGNLESWVDAEKEEIYLSMDIQCLQEAEVDT